MNEKYQNVSKNDEKAMSLKDKIEYNYEIFKINFDANVLFPLQVYCKRNKNKIEKIKKLSIYVLFIILIFIAFIFFKHMNYII